MNITYHTYFQVYINYFWQYEEDNSVISIPGSSTIIYVNHLIQILEYLSIQGIPSLGSLLLVLIASNPNWQNNKSEIQTKLTQTFAYVDNRTIEIAFEVLEVLIKHNT